MTDFVSVGSPLTHARMLLARNQDDIKRRVASRELPTSPPVYEDGEFSYPVTYTLPNGERETTRVAHHAAPFAVTRWTNIWFPSRLGVFGDWFGGPLVDTFGRGVRDRPVTAGAPTRFAPVLPHTHYFRNADAPAGRRPGGAISLLREGLDLDGDWLSGVPVSSTREPDR